MSHLLGLSFLFLFIVQGYGLEDPSPSKVGEFKNLVADWSESARRMIRSLAGSPLEEEAAVSSQLRDAMEEGRRQKRSPQDIQKMIQDLNDGFKQIITNITSSSVYQDLEKIRDNISDKGKELYGQIQEQAKNLQSKAAPQT